MKRIASLALVILMLLMMFAVPAVAETVTAEGTGFTDILFSNDYYGFCIDRELHGAYPGEQFTVAKDTTAATDNLIQADISQKLKLLFTLCFEDLFVSDGNGGYTIDSLKKDSTVPAVIYHLTENQYISGAAKTLFERIEAYDGAPIPDEGYQMTLSNGDVITFYFVVLIPEGAAMDGTAANGRQTFFAYKIAVNEPATPTPDPDPVEYTVTFVPNGGSGFMDNQVFEEGEEDNLTPNAFTNENYEFTGWNTEPDGTGISYSNEEKIKPESDITLYAQWEKLPEYTITFDGNGGEGTMDPQTVVEGKTEQLNSNEFEREGYKFVGWNTKPDGSGDSFNDRQFVTVENGSATLYAQWERVTPDSSGNPPLFPDSSDNPPPFPGGDENEWPSDSVPELPETGDASAPALWASLLLLSICGIVCMRRKAFSR